MKRLGSVHKNGPIEIHQIPARTDNYIYLFHDNLKNYTAVIDPGETKPVIDYCTERNWKISDILITHHHPDHTDGNLQLKKHFNCKVWGLREDAHRILGIDHYFEKDSTSEIAGHAFDIFFTPAHTLGHVCLYFKNLKWLFCGDTMFSFGCGRLFEGDAAMMLKALSRIRALPVDTTYFSGHEYTLVNLEFAMSLEPDSQALKEIHVEIKQLRDQGLPTVPALLKREVELSPFLRWDDPVLRKALRMEEATDLEVFTAVRTKRNFW